MAAGGVAEVPDGPVHEVEVDLTGTDEGRGNSRDVADAVDRDVAQDLDVFRQTRKG